MEVGKTDESQEVRIVCMGFSKALRDELELIIHDQPKTDKTTGLFFRLSEHLNEADLTLVDLLSSPIQTVTLATDFSPNIALIYPSDEMRRDIYRSGYYDYVTFPFIRDELHTRLAAAFTMKLKISTLRETTEHPIVEKALSVLKQNFSERISLSDLCSLCGCNHTTLTNLFNDAFGVPPMTWYRDERLRQAAGMLASSSESISAISFKLGFEDPNYFSVAFKRLFGITPSRFRKAEGNKESTENFVG
ncbi:helix-turn-helix transcriptional regulator [Thioclava sp. BHET1]|nr:helix-turn-helix transcriptional regulator [Thioclava sp. BHET1]